MLSETGVPIIYYSSTQLINQVYCVIVERDVPICIIYETIKRRL